MKFISAQSTLAKRGRGLARVLESVPSKVSVRNGTHSDRLKARKGIGTSDNWTFPAFASLPNTWCEN